MRRKVNKYPSRNRIVAEKTTKKLQPATRATLSVQRLWPLFIVALILLGVLGYWGTKGLTPTGSGALGISPSITAIAAIPTSNPRPPTPVRADVAKTAATNTPTRKPTFTRQVLSAGQKAAWQLTILHTNDTRGYLDPCG